ncbi:plasmid replication initiator RepA [Meridianimarinicoccus roseus]|uniref:Plasmid replication initiator RepA n=1 Tax=Meridianimarinicoccus roseus TaxID=2072018 RepID=A0A2V2L9J1_9RHOB|nr:replication initiator protein A [Meridianimarinicoccus roseus]PWR01955.1 plasmid replication initiator RepA [Meridianimarinicoccus roseus]
MSRGSGPPPPAVADFFVCDIAGALPKDDMATMEHPVFSLSTRPDRRVLRYDHGAASIEITPSVKGLATIHDKDVLIYCISQLVAAMNAGVPVARRIELVAHDLLVATRRETSGDSYRRLREAFERLSGTRIVTNIPTGETVTTTGFGLIEEWAIVRRTASGRMVSVSVVLSDWLFRAVLSRSVLTLAPGYFDLRKPLERRVYELARKHCGRQARWQVSMRVLCTKSGSASPLRVFRKMIRDMAAADLLPGYTLEVVPGDLVVVTPRRAALVVGDDGPPLPEGAHDAARAAAPGWDVHALEADWRAYWVATGRPRLRSPARAFVAYCAKRAASG